MKRVLGISVLLSLIVTGVLGQSGSTGGELLGKVISIESVSHPMGPATMCVALVFYDSSYTGQAVESGDTIQLFTPGGGQAVGYWDLFDGSLSTVSLVVGEKFFASYRIIEGQAYLVDKWTVWRRGALRQSATETDRKRLLEEDVKLEDFLSDPQQVQAFADSLVLFHTRDDMPSLARPVPQDGRSWRDYGLMCRKCSGTLRAVRLRMHGKE